MLDDARDRFAACPTLADAIVAGLRLTPSWQVIDIVIQDEFTHDVIFAPAPSGPAIVTGYAGPAIVTGYAGPAIVLDCT